MTDVPPIAHPVARQLLEAQVQYLLAELSGERLVDLLASDVQDLLAIADRLVLREVVDAAALKAAGHELVDAIGGSPMLADLTTALAGALYDLEASDSYDLGEIVDRDAVSALIAAFLSMRTLHDRALERMAESPLAAAVATRFIQQLVTDFIAQNRQAAERIPGASSLFSIGQSMASRAKSVSDRTLGGFIDGATDKGAQAALKRTNRAIRELLRDPQMHAAAMQLWDLHAGEPVSGLRTYLSRAELHTLVELVRDLVVAGRDLPFAHGVVDTCIDVFFSEYGDRTLAALLTDIGLTPGLVTRHLQAVVPPVVEAGVRSGAVEQLLRERLTPFFASPAVAGILAGESTT